jgi:hypothetical protein
MKNAAENIVNGLCILTALFLLWVALSWVDIIADNLKENPEHSNINAFVLLTNYMEEVKQ